MLLPMSPMRILPCRFNVCKGVSPPNGATDWFILYAGEAYDTFKQAVARRTCSSSVTGIEIASPLRLGGLLSVASGWPLLSRLCQPLGRLPRWQTTECRLSVLQDWSRFQATAF